MVAPQPLDPVGGATEYFKHDRQVRCCVSVKASVEGIAFLEKKTKDRMQSAQMLIKLIIEPIDRDTRNLQEVQPVIVFDVICRIQAVDRHRVLFAGHGPHDRGHVIDVIERSNKK